MAGNSHSGTDPGSPAGRIALAVAAQHAALLGELRAELGGDEAAALAAAAERLAREFGPVTAAAVEATVAQAPRPPPRLRARARGRRRRRRWPVRRPPRAAPPMSSRARTPSRAS